MSIDSAETPIVSETKPLAPLPFTYVKTNDPEKASGEFARGWGPRIERGSMTEAEALKHIKSSKEGLEWFYQEDWRKKAPQEQLEIRVGNHPITVYNFIKDKPFTEEHVLQAQKVFEQIGSHFPGILDKLRWILIDGGRESLYGDKEKYPLNGQTSQRLHLFRLFSPGMELYPHRIQAVSNFSGTLVHELTHVLAIGDLVEEWIKKTGWERVSDFPDKFETKPTPEDPGTSQRYDKISGQVVKGFPGYFPKNPKQCVTGYSELGPDEDLCESMVAYLYDPELLKRVSPVKFGILQKLDAQLPKPEVFVHRVPKEEVKLPEVKPETIYCYIPEIQAS